MRAEESSHGCVGVPGPDSFAPTGAGRGRRTRDRRRPGSARCTSQCVVYQQTDELSLQPIVTGHYEHAFARVDGDWRITSHRFFFDQIGDASQRLLV
jgi:hypothetical protein